MSTRTHAPECAKTKAHAELCPTNAVRRPHNVFSTVCTCGAEYQPSMEERMRAMAVALKDGANRLQDAGEWRMAEELRKHIGEDIWTVQPKEQPSVEERLEHAEHDRDTLEKLENAFEAVGGDLLDEVLGLRERLAQAERERDEARRLAENLRAAYVPRHREKTFPWEKSDG